MRNLLSVTFFSGMLTLTRMMSGFVIAKVISVYTGPTGLALLSQLQNFNSIATGLLTSSVNQGVVRYTAENKNRSFKECSQWWKGGLAISLTIVSIFSPIILLFAPSITHFLLGDKKLYPYVIVVIIISPFSILGTLMLSVLNGLQQYRRYIMISIVSVIMSCVMMVLLIQSYGVNGALISASIQNGVIGAIVLIFVSRQPWFKLNLFLGRIDKRHFLGMSSYTLMAIVSAIALPFTQIAIRYIMVNKIGWDRMGQWQAVWKISEVYLSVITISLSTYFLPKLATLTSMAQIQGEIKCVSKIVLPVVIIMALCIYFLRDLIITILFTEHFTESHRYFAVQLIGDVVKIMSWLYAYPMISRGMVKIYICTEIIFSILLILLSYFLINIYGAHGANYAYLITYLIYFFAIFSFMHHLTRRELNENFAGR
ncbi:O-antigen translocase [Salmonella enterica]|nr:O-antigen translocase [Salmonella enterica subsp. arizonae serovar 63:z36:-]HCL5372365.1 O-antigen translocase [Salmonella enterica]